MPGITGVDFFFFNVTNLGIIFETTVANKMSGDDRIVMMIL